VTAMYDWEANRSVEFNMKAGDEFFVVHRNIDGWAHVEKVDKRGQVGEVPANYVEDVPKKAKDV